MSDRRSQVLYFTGAHCPVCKRMAPDVQATAEQFDDEVDLVEIDVAAHPDRVKEHSVRAVPTLVALHDDTIVSRAVGAQSSAALDTIFRSAAGAEIGRLPLARGERLMRLGAALALGLIAFVASQPMLFVAAIGIAVFAFWDRRPMRSPKTNKVASSFSEERK
ncbi:MAG: thioredoxin family protein [Actinomycetota bacterium]|nr:thioredoxin family protein [Actinomycetota bacterium]